MPQVEPISSLMYMYLGYKNVAENVISFGLLTSIHDSKMKKGYFFSSFVLWSIDTKNITCDKRMSSAVLLILQGSEVLRNPVKSIISFMSAKTFFLSSLVKRQT